MERFLFLLSGNITVNMSKHCYHCGLPIANNLTITYPVLGETREFCCHGCQLACKTIVENGFEEFYRHRDSEGGLNAQVLPDILKNLSLYDRPEVQQSFVRHQGNQSQAALILENIRCAACLWLNEQHLRALPGVIDVQLDYTSHQASVTWDCEQIQLSQILEAIAAIGYIAHPYDPVHREQCMPSTMPRGATVP
jgi:Cu2+-exporting ATPase